MREKRPLTEEESKEALEAIAVLVAKIGLIGYLIAISQIKKEVKE